MRVTDLMIGDWVIDGKNIAQITSITCDGIIETTFNESSNIEIIEPIPLTSEILEKNGFHNDGVSFWYLDFRIVLSTSKGISLVCGRQKRFEYVHELQHALRLANIDKEIIL